MRNDDEIGPTHGEAVDLLLQAFGNPPLIEMEVAPFPAEDRMVPQRCFGNSLTIVEEDRQCHLVLGCRNYRSPANDRSFNFSHAWVQYPDGKFWDPTLDKSIEDRANLIVTYHGFVVPSLPKMWVAAKHRRRCAGTTTRGTPCKKWAQFPTDFCTHHGGFWVQYTDFPFPARGEELMAYESEMK